MKTGFGLSSIKTDIDVLKQVQQKPERWVGSGVCDVQKGAEKDGLA